MPKYKYVGKIPFVSLDYNIRVYPNEEFITDFFLPSSWDNFKLLESYNSDIVMKSVEYNIIETTEINIQNYSELKIVLINKDVSIVSVALGVQGSNNVLLDSNVFTFSLNSEYNISMYESIFVTPIVGAPILRIYYNVSNKL